MSTISYGLVVDLCHYCRLNKVFIVRYSRKLVDVSENAVYRDERACCADNIIAKIEPLEGHTYH